MDLAAAVPPVDGRRSIFNFETRDLMTTCQVQDSPDLIPDWAKSVLTDADLEVIAKAIREAERLTEAEIVPVMARSSQVDDVSGPRTLALLALVVGFFPPIFAQLLWLFQSETWTIGAVALAAILLLVGAMSMPRLGRLTGNRRQRALAVAVRAQLEFYRLGLESTRGRTGILLFLSLDERQAVVLADRAISEKMPKDIWESPVSLILQGAKRGRLAEGLAAAISTCGGLAAPHFPIKSGDLNELRNKLHFV